jgi:hypothetical protein
MLVRKFSVRLKPDSAGPFIQKIENQIIPLLRKQKGFLDEMTLISSNGKEMYAYSFWECSEDAERYSRTAYSEVISALDGLIEEPVRVNTYMVANSTFYKLAAAVAVAS